MEDETAQGLKNVKGVRGSCPPPFLMKTFAMVEDPNTNFLISWSCSGTSFIIWDHLKFSAELLPTYFKHSNFSSFLYQLNNYGFKKIGLRQYEYENNWFQAGQQPWLHNIKRRNECDNQELPRKRRQYRKRYHNADQNDELKAELEMLRDNIALIKMEMQKLKQGKSDFEKHLGAFKQLVQNTEAKWEKTVMFLTRISSSSFVEQITYRIEQEQGLEGHQTVKKRVLDEPEKSSTSSPGVNDSGGDRIQGQEANNATSEAVASENCDARVIWKKFLGDDSVSENEAEKEEAEQISKMDMAFEDFMASKIVMEEKDVIATEPIMDMEDGVTLQLWA